MWWDYMEQSAETHSFSMLLYPRRNWGSGIPLPTKPIGAGLQLGWDQRRTGVQVSSSLVSWTAQRTLLSPHCLVPVSSKPFLTRVPSSPGWSSAERLAKDGLRLLILLPPEFWDYTCAPPCLPGVIFYRSFLCDCVFGEELNEPVQLVGCWGPPVKLHWKSGQSNLVLVYVSYWLTKRPRGFFSPVFISCL